MGYNEKQLIILEKQIRGKMHAIKNKLVTPKDSGIGILMNKMKLVDEPMYESLLKEYVEIYKNFNKENLDNNK